MPAALVAGNNQMAEKRNSHSDTTRPTHTQKVADSSAAAPTTLLSKDHIDPGEKELQLSARELPHALREKIPVDGHNLRNIRHGIFRQPGEGGRKGDVPWRGLPTKIAGRRHAHYCRDSTTIESFPLDDDDRPSEPRTRSYRSGQLSPPNLALGDHHSLCSRTRWAAAETNSSFGFFKSA